VRPEIDRREALQKVSPVSEPAQLDALFDGVH
jgi:hypothetical protein